MRHARVGLMPMREAWRPPWYAWAGFGLAVLLSLQAIAPSHLEGRWLIITPVLALLAVLALRRMWELPPAITMCAAVVLTTFSGGWRLIGLGGLPLDRVLIVIVLFQLLLRAPGVKHLPRLRIRNVHLLMAVTVMYVLGSAAAAGTLTSETGYLSLVDQLGITPYLMFLAAPAVFSGQRERNMLLVTLVGLGAYLGLTAVFEALGPHSLVFPRYIVQVDNELRGERAGGPFQSSLAEGFATFACSVAAVIAFAKWHGQRRRHLAAGVAVLCAFACFVTLERGVWVAAIAATVITALATPTGRRWLVPGALACAIAIGGTLAISSNLARKTSARASSQISVWDRQNQTAAGVRMLKAKPLLGFGWASYARSSLEYFRQSANYPMVGYTLGTAAQGEKPLPLHNTYLSYAVELGLLGAALWLATTLWGIGGAIFNRGGTDLREWKLGLLAIATFFLVVAAFNPYQQAFPAFVLWVWAGVALGCTPAAAPAHARDVARSSG